jgi:hypothetical protein
MSAYRSCTKESQVFNEALKNERIKLEQIIDSLKKQQFIVTAFNDSLFLLNRNIMENMESRERNDRLMNERKQLELEVNGNRNINEQLKRQNQALIEQINKDNFALESSRTIYIVKIKIHQTTYTLDLEEHIKNKINDTNEHNNTLIFCFVPNEYKIIKIVELINKPKKIPTEINVDKYNV